MTTRLLSPTNAPTALDRIKQAGSFTFWRNTGLRVNVRGVQRFLPRLLRAHGGQAPTQCLLMKVGR
jgi:hypothetical protein